MKYYAMIDGEQRGPYELSELPNAGVRPSTYIWRKGLADWIKAEDDADVCRLFRNHLYDVMHPTLSSSPNNLDAYKVKPDEEPNPHRSRFDYYLGGESLPTLEEIEAQEDKNVPPVSMVGYAWLVTVLCFFPTGIAALIYAYKSKKQWKLGNNILAHGYSRSAKMWIGITFFLGLIFYAFLFAFLWI